jgi:undecaprenyl-diphosphatase
MEIVDSIILGIVEGLTEFLPISSTGHMIVTSSLLGISEDSFTKMFEVVIQLGAILAVVAIYWKKFIDFSKWQFYVKLFVGVIPALVFGGLLHKHIKSLLDSNLTVAISLLLGGIVFLFVDKWFKNPKYMDEKEISFKQSFIIGCWQVLAMIPGVSRSGASIIGGMQQGLNRGAAAEFSFFLAVPTMCAAAGKDLLDFYGEKGSIDNGQWLLLGIGMIVSFVVAIMAIKLMVSFVRMYGFKPFGYYRIIAGLVIIALVAAGVLKK